MAKSPSSRQQAARHTPPNLATPQSRHLSRGKNRTPSAQRRLLRVATKAALESRWQSRVLEAGNHRPSTRMAPLWGIPPPGTGATGGSIDGTLRPGWRWMGRNWTTPLLDPRPGLSRESINRIEQPPIAMWLTLRNVATGSHRRDPAESLCSRVWIKESASYGRKMLLSRLHFRMS